MLVGRRGECEALDRAVAEAREGRGEAIVLHGEAGIGKTALLEYAIQSAAGFRVLRTTGNEAERDLPFAALQRLCAADVAALDGLPEPQRDALRVAFGLTTGVAPDRLLVGLALLSLLSLLAAERPLLCAVDDTQWLDKESAQACGFAARRIATEAVAFLFAARRVPSEIGGLREVGVPRLGRSASLELLHSVLPDRVDERVIERFIAEAHGNPLALLELPRGLTPSRLAGGYSLPVSVPVPGRIEASFRRRFGALPADSRRLLLIAAADPTGDPLLVRRAAALLGVDESAAIAVEADGLLELDPRVVFRHPLVRSAVYQAASPEERRKAHGGLAEATDVAADPDRRAWHRAQATLHPDDGVAADLEASAGRAQARGGFAAAAAFLERSAELTADLPRRAARALSAAEAKRQAGALDDALVLANEAERGPLDGFQRAQLEVLRGRISFASDRGNEAPLLLYRAAQHLEPFDAQQACEIYLDAMTAALFAGRLAQGCSAREVAEAALATPRPIVAPRAPDLLLDALARLIAGDPASGTAVLRRALDAFGGDDAGANERVRWSWLAGRAAAFIWDYDTWDALTARQLEVASQAGALAVLPLALSTRAGVHLFAGELSVAASLVQQVEAVADATDTRTARYAAVAVAAFRGREQEARSLIDANAADFESRGEGMGITLTHWARAALYNGLARYGDAFAAAEEALVDPRELWFSPWATVELVEAASRTGRADAARPALERLARVTSASATVWALSVEERCRALLSDGATAEACYRAALDRLGPSPLRVDLARTRLVYGEWLRRERRHVEARAELRAAHEMFAGFGMEAFAERARVELRATGEHTRRRGAETGGDLTPQESQISRLVAGGASNLEIAGQLFISPSTVEYHLHKVFRKLGVTSRTQLARRVLEPAGERPGDDA